ncbi:MAG: pilus assembly protein PilP, partial [Bdellovibrionia bacterium]
SSFHASSATSPQFSSNGGRTMSVVFIGLLLISTAYGEGSTTELPKNSPATAPKSLVSMPIPEVSSTPNMGSNNDPNLLQKTIQDIGTLGAGPLSVAQIDALFSTSIAEFIYKLRDPFKMSEAEIKVSEAKTDLERYPIGEFKLVGVLTGPKHIRAMLLAPDGKTYFVSERAKIGVSGGIVHRIAPDGIQIREKVVNAIGEVENMDSMIKMASADKSKGSGRGQSGMMQGQPGMMQGQPGMMQQGSH